MMGWLPLQSWWEKKDRGFWEDAGRGNHNDLAKGDSGVGQVYSRVEGVCFNTKK